MEEENIRIDLIIRYLIGNYSVEEEIELTNWIKQSVENEKYFKKFKYAWIASAQLKPVNEEEFEKAASDFKSRILQSTKIENDKKLLFLTIFSNKIFRYAALILIAFLLGTVTQKVVYRKSQISSEVIDKYFNFESPRGSRAIATLPDGTKVWLNASSKISYSLDYNVRERIVMLEGEAYFDVTTNPSKPFIVKASNLDIKAFGTMFNVKAYPEENQVITTLVEGKVTVEGVGEDNKHFSLKMDPKQCVIYSTDKKSVADLKQEVPSDEKNLSDVPQTPPSESPVLPIVMKTLPKPEINTSWKDERWIVANEDLKNLSVMLERRFNVNIKLLNEELKEYHFTGIIQNETIEQVMNILSLTMPVKYTIELNNIELVLNQELKNRYINALKSK